MAYFVSDEFPEADLLKIMKMCLIHDLGEAFTGDIPAFEKTDKDSEKEADVLGEWVKTLTEPFDKEMAELYQEMEEQQTLEARIYKALDKLEALGVVSPITALDVRYKRSALFPQVIAIQVTLTRLTGVRLHLHYVMKNPQGEVVFEGNSEHCFQDRSGRILRLKKHLPGFAQALQEQLVPEP